MQAPLLQVSTDELLKVKSLSEFLLQSMVLRVLPLSPVCESSKVEVCRVLKKSKLRVR